MSAAPEKQYYVAALDGDNALAHWDDLEPIIERALEHDYDSMTTNQILARVLLGELTLIFVGNLANEIVAAATLEFVNRGERICHCMTFSGDDMAEWVDEFIDTWKQIAKQTGCRYLSIKGRPGWARYASKRYGFEHRYTQMALDISEEN